MRSTKQKELIFAIINNSRSHLTAQETYEEAKKIIANISLGTVYRILNGLVESNQILRIATSSGVDHFDRISTKHHNHFICDNCNQITDIFKADYTFDKSELKDYQLNDVEIIFTGICNECTKGRK